MKEDLGKDLFGNAEYPFDDTKLYGNELLVGGWVFATDGDDVGIHVLVDGDSIERGKWGLARYDVYQHYQTEASYESGYFVNINIHYLSFGKHRLSIIAEYKNNEYLFKTINFIKINKFFKKLSVFDRIKKRNPSPNEFEYKNLIGKPIPAGAAPGSVKKSGKVMFDYFIEVSDLKPSAKVLEVGCGMGRFAIPFSRYLLDNGGSYTGLEILAYAVNYLRKNVKPKYPNFDIDIANVYSELYNPEGEQSASTFSFPYVNGNFDFVFLQSVFTHLVPSDLENYLFQIARVLKKGGKCLITYFLLNDETKKLIRKDIPGMKFPYEFEGFWSASEEVPEYATAFDEVYIRKLYQQFNLSIIDPIHFGNWRGIEKRVSQDIVIAQKF